jgi:DNA-binding CsgD family transcriptional regulator/tetratricopeptide (TPR) repeat protein
MLNAPDLDNSGKLAKRLPDAGKLLRELEAKFRLSSDARERALLADWIVPEYITYGDAERAADVLDRVAEIDDPEIASRIAALRAEVQAMQGRDPEPAIRHALSFVDSVKPEIGALLKHRVGLAYFFARQPNAAEEHSLQALWLADVHGLRRLASRTASVLYAVHYMLTGDMQAALYYAEVATVEAAAAGDAMFRRQFLIAQFDLSVTFAAWDRAKSLLEMLRRDRWYDTYSASVTARVGTVILHGHAGDYNAMKGAADSLLESATSGPDTSLGLALRALALAAGGEDDEAGKSARRALSLSREQALSELGAQTVRRRLAAVLAAYVCVLIGDVHRGTRALQTRAKWSGDIGALARALLVSLRSDTIDIEDPTLQTMRGLAELASGVRKVRLNRVARIPERIRTLTHTELTLLRATATGKTNGEIARERGVTRNAVERRLMRAYEKLGVRNRTEAIAKLAET